MKTSDVLIYQKCKVCFLYAVIRKKFFTMQVAKHWSRLSRRVVGAPLLETFKAGLDVALRKLILLNVPAHCREWEETVFEGPSPSHSMFL